MKVDVAVHFQWSQYELITMSSFRGLIKMRLQNIGPWKDIGSTLCMACKASSSLQVLGDCRRSQGHPEV